MFLHPPVTDDYTLAAGHPDPEGIRKMLCDGYDFSRNGWTRRWKGSPSRPGRRRLRAGSDTGKKGITGQSFCDTGSVFKNHLPVPPVGNCERTFSVRYPSRTGLAGVVSFSTTTAVPYASSSVIVCPISEESNCILTTAFAPRACACSLRPVERLIAGLVQKFCVFMDLAAYKRPEAGCDVSPKAAASDDKAPGNADCPCDL